MWSRKYSDVASFESYDAIILAVPAQAVRDVLTVIKPPKDIPLIISAKGIEQSSAKFMNEVVAEIVPGAHVFVLSGPSFASRRIKGHANGCYPCCTYTGGSWRMGAGA